LRTMGHRAVTGRPAAQGHAQTDRWRRRWRPEPACVRPSDRGVTGEAKAIRTARRLPNLGGATQGGLELVDSQRAPDSPRRGFGCRREAG
jgi:hypothetical protein